MKLYFLGLIALSLFNLARLQNVTVLNCDYGTVPTESACEECGKTDVTPNIKIVGGQQANPNSWPAQALLIQSYKTDFYLSSLGTTQTLSVKFKCGGTLINSKTILTAAHCINKHFTYDVNGRTYTIPMTPNIYYPTYESMFKVYLGAHDVSFVTANTNPTSPAIQKTVSRVVVHSSYNTDHQLNDIALLILSSAVQTNSAIKYACLPKQQSSAIPATNLNCYASGWGTLTEGGSSPNVLYNVKLTTYGPTSCSNVLTSYIKNWNSQICAGDITGNKDTCQGDSGGGLYILDPALNKYIVVGVTSYGEGCARVGKPGVYTRVSYYIDWIKSNWQSSSNMQQFNLILVSISLVLSLFFF